MKSKLFKTKIFYLFAVFLYAVCIMFLFREVIIPKFLPSINGDILGDTHYFSQIAQKKAQQMVEKGLGEFEVFPQGQGGIGIASLFIFITGSVSSIIILNSFLHTLSCLFMFLILRNWFSLQISMIATMPLALSYATMFWFSQVNKDTFILTGAMGFMCAYMNLVFSYLKTPRIKVKFERFQIFYLLLLTFSLLIIGFTKPYLNQILAFTLIPVAIFLITKNYRSLWNSSNLLSFGIKNFLVFLLLFSFPVPKGSATEKTISHLSNYTYDPVAYEKPLPPPDAPTPKDLGTICLLKVDNKNWVKSGYIPNWIDEKLRVLAGQRCMIFTILEQNPNATIISTVVDQDHLLEGAIDTILYLPRAFLLGVLSPLPSDWKTFFKAKISLLYKIRFPEILLYYVCFFGLIIILYRRRHPLMFIPVVFAFSAMVFAGFTTPFLVVIYRYRYPWWMLIICLGLASLLSKLKRFTPDRSHLDSV